MCTLNNSTVSSASQKNSWWVALAGHQEKLRGGESPNPRLRWAQSESELGFGAAIKHVVASVQEKPQPPWFAPWRGISRSEGGGTSATTTSVCVGPNYTELTCHLPFTRFCVYNIVVFSPVALYRVWTRHKFFKRNMTGECCPRKTNGGISNCDLLSYSTQPERLSESHHLHIKWLARFCPTIFVPGDVRHVCLHGHQNTAQSLIAKVFGAQCTEWDVPYNKDHVFSCMGTVWFHL